MRLVAVLKLGIPNLIRVFLYRIGVVTGLNPVRRLKTAPIVGPFYSSVKSVVDDAPPPSLEPSPFGWMPTLDLDDIDWHKSCVTGEKVKNTDLPWFQISDFDSGVGDIKGVWEASRFDWVIQLTQRHATGDEIALDRLNNYLSDWVLKNPTYQGPNWKCGQEASIRVMHLAMSALILGQSLQAEKGLLDLVKVHLERIAPTLSYAIAQDNNHGTSEACALFIGGSWLAKHGCNEGNHWMKVGRKWIENRALKLISEDGSFSQHSTNYHRVMLDSYVMAEVWREKLALPEFTENTYCHLKEAVNWLYQMIDRNTGDVPNLGANDGARLLQLTQTDYRDFRPSVQLASAVFCKAIAWEEPGDYDTPLIWLEVKRPNQLLEDQKSFHFPQGGYLGLRLGKRHAFALLNYPVFKFRPSQCDGLHIDFWLDGKNVLRDGGSFSYNAGEQYLSYYCGTESHNTVQFDGREQMPRISRFLLGHWLKSSKIKFDQRQGCCGAQYQDYCGATHAREMRLRESKLSVTDTLTNFNKNAIIRWRLSPDKWTIQGQKVSNGSITIKITSDSPISRVEIVRGRESKYYYHESDLPVLEVEVTSSGTITTEFNF